MNLFKKCNTLTVSLLTLLFVVSSAAAQDVSFYSAPADNTFYPTLNHRNVKNVILLIGDGMGYNAILSARTKAVGMMNKLHMDKMPISGTQYTHADAQLVTDSAASGTALSSGYKTKNGRIGMTSNEKSVKTILEYNRDMGKATGLVATSTITHATPASFAAHVPSRSDQRTIAEHMFAAKVNVLFGGGRGYFIPKSEEGSYRKDDKDLMGAFEKAGYTLANTRDRMLNASGPNVVGFFQRGPLNTNPDPYTKQRQKETGEWERSSKDILEPSIAEMTAKAIEILSKDEDGFFLMTEGSQIDWRAHGNAFDLMIRQVLLFDLAVKEALEFAAKDGNTLVIVTADHETGGLMLADNYDNATDLNPKWATGGHTPTPIPIYAFGPGAEDFSGFYQNIEIPKKIAKLLGISPFPGKEY